MLRCLTYYRHGWPLWLLLGLLTLIPPVAVLSMALVEKRLLDDVVLAGSLDQLVPTLLLYAGLWLAVTGVQLVSAVLNTYLNERLTQRLRQRMLAHFDALSLAFANREHSGRIMSLISNDVGVVTGLVGSTLFGAIGAVWMLLISGATMFGLSWQLAIIVAIVPPVVGALAAVVTRPLRPAARRVQEKAAELTAQLQENLTGIREIVSFGREHSQGLAFAAAQTHLLRLKMRLVYMDTALQTGQTLLSLTITLVILGYGGYLVMTGQTSVGALFAIRSLFSYGFSSVSKLFGTVSAVQRALASADRVHGFLDEEPAVKDRPSARPISRAAGAVAFENVSFAYQADRPVLKDVSFAVQPGEMVALVGPSGAGKTTLVSLLARFHDPVQGLVRLDGTDLRDLTLRSLREQVGTVFQDTFLFATSIRENIAFGREGATEEEIVAAARAANAWEFIEALPEGLATQVGQRGVQLSEGQKQRIAIARALLRNPPILILDEPTSALDARSEHLLQRALETLMRDRTTFVIAHRLATIQRADRILVLEDGHLVEQGTHLELLGGHGLYRELFELQFGAPGRRAPVGADLPEPVAEVNGAVHAERRALAAV